MVLRFLSPSITFHIEVVTETCKHHMHSVRSVKSRVLNQAFFKHPLAEWKGRLWSHPRSHTLEQRDVATSSLCCSFGKSWILQLFQQCYTGPVKICWSSFVFTWSWQLLWCSLYGRAHLAFSSFAFSFQSSLFTFFWVVFFHRTISKHHRCLRF